MLALVLSCSAALLRAPAPRMQAPGAATPFAPGTVARDGTLISEEAALWALANMRSVPVRVDTDELPDTTVKTVFLQGPAPPPGKAQDGEQRPVVLFLHGADFSCLEWRFMLRGLAEQGLDCVALDWWNGGWTERSQILSRLREPDAYRGEVQPWTLARQHIYAFWEQQLERRPLILVGASLGGAVAVDFASSHPEAVAKLALIDAGGESFKSPPPDQVALLASPVSGIKSLFQELLARSPNEDARIVSLHRAQPDFQASSLAYLKSGGMQRRVGPALIRTVQAPTLVVWGTDDDILPLQDAYAFQADLPTCVGVREVAGAGHSPHLDKPGEVLPLLAEFATSSE